MTPPRLLALCTLLTALAATPLRELHAQRLAGAAVGLPWRTNQDEEWPTKQGDVWRTSPDGERRANPDGDRRGTQGGEAPAAVEAIPRIPEEPQWWMPLASAVVPGTGQALLRQDRFVVYATIEGVAWLRYAAERRESTRQRRAYRSLANSVARAFFSATFPSGDFEYYERMQHFVESGVFDRDPSNPQLEPELDTLTFNGALWLLARRTFWAHPDSVPPTDSDAYLRAADYYLQEAVRPEFRWSWRNAQLEHDLYRRTIAESNEASRQALQALGVVLANHVLSTVDAYVTLRLWTRQEERRSVGVSATIPWAPLGRGGGADARR